MLVINQQISIPFTEFDFSFSRSPGPGGQNVNKVNTKVTLKWRINSTKAIPVDVRERFCTKYHRRISKAGELIVTSHRFRDQGRNVADSLHKLREMLLEVAEPPKKRKPPKKSKAANRKRLENKRRNSERKKSRQSIRSND